jgi:hypothetical protein
MVRQARELCLVCDMLVRERGSNLLTLLAHPTPESDEEPIGGGRVSDERECFPFLFSLRLLSDFECAGVVLGFRVFLSSGKEVPHCLIVL